jgi:membrane-associated phospholipid phosphatase
VSEARPVSAPPRLLPERWRRAFGWVAPLCVLGVAALGWGFAGQRSSGPFDTALDNALIAAGEPHYYPLLLLADFGSPPAMLLGIVVLVIAARRTERGRPAIVLAVAGPVLASLVTEVLLKPLVDRRHEGGLSLPSGHVTSISAQIAVFLVVFVAAGLPARTWLRRVLVALGLLMPVGVSVAMVSLEQHYVTDTLAGMLVGPCVIGALALLLDSRS